MAAARPRSTTASSEANTAQRGAGESCAGRYNHHRRQLRAEPISAPPAEGSMALEARSRSATATSSATPPRPMVERSTRASRRSTSATSTATATRPTTRRRDLQQRLDAASAAAALPQHRHPRRPAKLRRLLRLLRWHADDRRQRVLWATAPATAARCLHQHRESVDSRFSHNSVQGGLDVNPDECYEDCWPPQRRALREQLHA